MLEAVCRQSSIPAERHHSNVEWYGNTAGAGAPFPASLAGVSVLINGLPAPIYFVSPIQINALVPYATTGATASILVSNKGTMSNTVQVPVAATAPGVFSIDRLRRDPPRRLLAGDFRETCQARRDGADLPHRARRSEPAGCGRNSGRGD